MKQTLIKHSLDMHSLIKHGLTQQYLTQYNIHASVNRGPSLLPNVLQLCNQFSKLARKNAKALLHLGR